MNVRAGVRLQLTKLRPAGSRAILARNGLAAIEWRPAS